MKRALLFFIIPILLFSCYKEEVFYQPSGKVEKVYRYSEKIGIGNYRYYYYNANDKIAKETVISESNEELGDIKYTYNSLGQLIRKENTIPSDYELTEYTYDEHGRLLNVRGMGIQAYDCFYDDMDRLIKKGFISGSNQQKDFYQEITYLYDGIYMDRITDEILRSIDSGPEDEAIQYHLQYIYDTDGKLERKELIDGLPFLYRGTKEAFFYDSQGRLFKQQFYNLNMGLPHTFGLDATYTYYYFE